MTQFHDSGASYDSLVHTRVTELAQVMNRQGLMLSTAESCTGGWIAKCITDAAGSSSWFDTGFVTYSNQAKQRLLNVQATSLERWGAVSEPVAMEMAVGAVANSAAQVAVSVTGIAGPGGGSDEKPVGLVYHALHWRLPATNEAHTWPLRWQFDGDREAVRQATVLAVMEHLLQRLNALDEAKGAS